MENIANEYDNYKLLSKQMFLKMKGGANQARHRENWYKKTGAILGKTRNIYTSDK